ncbi:MAG TPA: hypothetical protein PK762_11400 [Candidatus Kapabacteria bacterium]|nr:hypothetical protein [Candidatus Kapabacteria bacterium]
MKKKIFLLVAALAIVFANVVVNACPAGWTSGAGTITYNGCVYVYMYCYGISNGYHCITMTDLAVRAPCTPEDFEDNSQAVTDQILLQIGAYLDNQNFFEDSIPPCPGGMCLLNISDNICYNGWYYSKGYYHMKTEECKDGKPRACNETIYYCFEVINGQKVYRLIRNGFPIGEPCKYPCQSSCQ